MNKVDCENFIISLFEKHLGRTYFTFDELTYHSGQIFSGYKTLKEKELEFINCEEAKAISSNSIIKKFSLTDKHTDFDICYIKYVYSVLKDEMMVENYFDKWGTKNKIAVTYSGHIRNFFNYISFSEKNFYSKVKPDIFMHTWNDYGFQNKNNHMPNEKWLMENQPTIDKKLILSKISPKKLIIENQKEKLETFAFPNTKQMFYFIGQAKDNASKYINSQLYSIHSSNSLKNDYEKELGFKYDLSIRMRYDFCLTKEVNLIDLSKILYLSREHQNLIFVANPNNSHHGHPGGGGGCISCEKMFAGNKVVPHEHSNDICDVLAIGSSKNMDFYSNLYTNAEKVYNKHSRKNFENINKHNLEFVKDGNMHYIVQFGDAIEKHTTCYYPEKLLSKYLEKFVLLHEEVFTGEIRR